MKTVTLKVVISVDRHLHLVVPEDIPPGPAEVVVHAPEATVTKHLTAGDLLRSPLFGIWKDRTDMGDSVEFARKLLAEAERRHRA
jgi:hypothetical protein